MVLFLIPDIGFYALIISTFFSTRNPKKVESPFPAPCDKNFEKA